MRGGWMIALAALALVGCDQNAELSADKGWARLPAIEGRPAAAYFTLTAGAEANTLVAVSSPIAMRAEMHESMTGAAGMSTMLPMSEIPVPAGATVTFAPGGKHIMLFDVNPAAKAGTTAPILLSFADGKTIEVTAQLVAAGDPAPQ